MNDQPYSRGPLILAPDPDGQLWGTRTVRFPNLNGTPQTRFGFLDDKLAMIDGEVQAPFRSLIDELRADGAAALAGSSAPARTVNR